MKIKDLKLMIANLDDDSEISSHLIDLITRPDWTKGKELWAEWKNEDETFGEALERITGNFLTDTPCNMAINEWKDGGIRYFRMKNGFVIVTFPACWSIQEDPTFER